MDKKLSDRMMASFQSPSLVEYVLAPQKQMEALMKSMESSMSSSMITSVIESQKQFVDLGKSMSSFASDSMKSMIAFQKQMKSFSKSMEPSFAAVKQFEEQSALLSRSFEPLSRLLQQEVDDIKKFQTIDIQPLFETFDLVNEMWNPAIEAMTSMSKLGAAYKTDISKLQNITKGLTLNVRHLDFIESYVDIQESYKRATESAAPNPIETVIAEITEQAHKAPKGVLSSDRFFTILIALIFFLAGEFSGDQKEENIISQMKELELNLTKRFNDIGSSNNEGIFYVVKRRVNLRAKPTTRSEILNVLPPSLKVKLIDRKSKWIKIEYFDYLGNAHKSGWVFKKYLKKINRQ